MYPGEHDSTGVYVLWNLLQCGGGALTFFYSPYLLLHWQLIILLAMALIALICFTKLDLLMTK